MKEQLIKHLAAGKTQQEIADIFKKKGITPSSVSSIEKMLKALKAEHGAKTSFHLAVILCRTGVIERKAGT